MVEQVGWVYIEGARKWHYVDKEGRSLCRRWLYLGRTKPSDENHDSPDNCPTCRKKLRTTVTAADGERKP